MKRTIERRLDETGEYGLTRPWQEEIGELSTYDNHPADVASELFERAKDVGLRDGDKIRLQEIDRALAAMEEGSYGTCAKCGQPIPFARLEAYPTSLLCVPCKQRDEAIHPTRKRPIEEEFLEPGFGRTDTDDTTFVIFDGEDAWQAVARYNELPPGVPNYEEEPLNDNEGIVEHMDAISNEEYRNQRPSRHH